MVSPALNKLMVITLRADFQNFFTDKITLREATYIGAGVSMTGPLPISLDPLMTSASPLSTLSSAFPFLIVVQTLLYSLSDFLYFQLTNYKLFGYWLQFTLNKHLY